MKKRLKIAMVGMYGGMWREYNPGCFLLGYMTARELKKRLPFAQIDLYAIDNKAEQDRLVIEKRWGLTLRFFSRKQQLRLLEDVLPRYDALVFGGDIIWGGDDVVDDNEIFFVRSPAFLKAQKPMVLFNSVHTFYDDGRIASQREKFVDAAARASYVSVRTEAIRKRLRSIGIDAAVFVPDPVLDLDTKLLARYKLPRFRENASRAKRPVLGISLRSKLASELIDLLKHADLSAYDVLIFPYSRQYENLETVLAVEKAFGKRFSYIKEYLNPFQSYRLTSELDAYITDAYHGAIAAALYGVPFVSIDVEAEKTSRKQQLLETLKIPERYNIRLAYGDRRNASTLIREVPKLLRQPLRYDRRALARARRQIRLHFDRMAEMIKRSIIDI